ncbi:MAG: DUF3667 domain-containing protein [Bacteroidota bacterium]
MKTQECLNCSHSFTGKYCSNCGEKVYSEHDKTIGHLFEEITHFLTHFEGTFFRSLKAMFTKPGLLAQDYCRGVRKRYFKPVSLYIFVVVIYLIFPIMAGLNMPLENYRGQRFFGSMVNASIVKKLEQKQITFPELSYRFEKKSEKISKIMLIVILPLCSFVLLLLWWRKKEFYFFDHFILSAEINSFFLIFQFFLIPFVLSILGLILGGNFWAYFGDENNLMPILVFLQSLYLIMAFKRFYGGEMWGAILKGFVFCITQFFIVFAVYKSLLYTTIMLLI